MADHHSIIGTKTCDLDTADATIQSGLDKLAINPQHHQFHDTSIEPCQYEAQHQTYLALKNPTTIKIADIPRDVETSKYLLQKTLSQSTVSVLCRPSSPLPSLNQSVTEQGEYDGDGQKNTVLNNEAFVPPLNFCLVEDSIYRSGFPMPINYPFLKQLGIKTIIYLGDLGNDNKDKLGKKKDKHGTAEIMINYENWIRTTDIKFHKLLFDSPQEPFIHEEKQLQAQKSMTIALQLLLDKNNFPILIHSNKGKHRIGVLVGLMRKILQGWCMSGIFEEYENFAMGKSEYDLEFIELWQPELWVDDNTKPDFVRI
jgi:tyrosine-protein phosphatase-like protein OCA2